MHNKKINSLAFLLTSFCLVGCNRVDINAHTHSYNPGTIVWHWADDHSTCNMDISCTTCTESTANHTINVEAVVNSEIVKEASCGISGITRYVATALVDTVQYSTSEDVVIPAHKHEYIYDSDKDYHYQTCKLCGIELAKQPHTWDDVEHECEECHRPDDAWHSAQDFIEQVSELKGKTFEPYDGPMINELIALHDSLDDRGMGFVKDQEETTKTLENYNTIVSKFENDFGLVENLLVMKNGGCYGFNSDPAFGKINVEEEPKIGSVYSFTMQDKPQYSNLYMNCAKKMGPEYSGYSGYIYVYSSEACNATELRARKNLAPTNANATTEDTANLITTTALKANEWTRLEINAANVQKMIDFGEIDNAIVLKFDSLIKEQKVKISNLFFGTLSPTTFNRKLETILKDVTLDNYEPYHRESVCNLYDTYNNFDDNFKKKIDPKLLAELALLDESIRNKYGLLNTAGAGEWQIASDKYKGNMESGYDELRGSYQQFTFEEDTDITYDPDNPEPTKQSWGNLTIAYEKKWNNLNAASEHVYLYVYISQLPDNLPDGKNLLCTMVMSVEGGTSNIINQVANEGQLLNAGWNLIELTNTGKTNMMNAFKSKESGGWYHYYFQLAVNFSGLTKGTTVATIKAGTVLRIGGMFSC